jgi:hypothetical protein
MNRRLSTAFLSTLITPSITLGLQVEKVTTKEPPSVDGWVIVEEDVWLMLADEADDHFIEARDSYLAKDNKDAAEELREAAAFLRVEARRTSEKAREELYDSAKELEKLATRAERGEIKSVEEMEPVFARADEALARHYHAKADHYWKTKQPQRAGRALEAATDAIDNSMHWSKQQAESAWDKTKETTRKVTAKLAEGTGWVAEEVGEALKATSEELKNLAKKVRTVRDDEK